MHTNARKTHFPFCKIFECGGGGLETYFQTEEKAPVSKLEQLIATRKKFAEQWSQSISE